MDFREVATRDVIDLPAMDADGLGPEELSERLVAAARWLRNAGGKQRLPSLPQGCHSGAEPEAQR